MAAATAAVAVVALAYSPALHAAFVWDDHVLAEAGAPFRHASIGDLMTGTFWPESSLADARAPYYRPLVLLSLRFDLLRGGSSADFHTTNLVLHLLGCVFLGLAAIRLRARAEVAIAAALLWGLAPRLSESVVWISGRTDLLAGALGLGALVACPDLGPSAPTLPRPLTLWARSLVTGVLLFGALASKEVAIAFVVAIVVGAMSRGGSASWRGERARIAAYLGLPVLLWLGLRSAALAGKGATLRDLDSARRAATVFEALERYAEMTLDALRPRTSIGMLGEVDAWRAAIGALLAVALAAALLWRLAAKRRPNAADAPNVANRVALALGGTALALVIHVVPFTLAGSVTADRLLYVPLAALALAAASALTRWRAPNPVRRGLGVAGLIVATLFAGATKARAEDYGDEVRFWVVAAEESHPHNTLALAALAALARDGDEVVLGCRLFERAASILGASERAGLAAHRRARENLVGCWARSGRHEDALRLAEELARDYPTAGRVVMALGYARLAIRDFAGARTAFARAAALDPGLSVVLAPAVTATDRAAAEAARFERPEERATDRIGWARQLARVGRGRDAERAFFGLATDATAPLDEREEATAYLALDGSIEQATAAAAAVGISAPMSPHLTPQLMARRARKARIVAYLPRITKLAVLGPDPASEPAPQASSR